MYLDDKKNFDVLIFVEMQSERILKRSAVHTYLFAGGWGGEGGGSHTKERSLSIFLRSQRGLVAT